MIDNLSSGIAWAYRSISSITIGSVFVRPEEVISTVEKFFPMGASQQELVWKMAGSLQKARGGVSTVAMLVLVWGSMRFFEVLVQGVNRAWHRVLLPWWKLPLKNLGMMLVIASAMGFGLFAPAVLQAGERAVRAFDSFLEQLVPGNTFVFAGEVLRYEALVEDEVYVSRASDEDPQIPSYEGGKFPLSTYLAARVRGLIADPGRWRALHVCQRMGAGHRRAAVRRKVAAAGLLEEVRGGAGSAAAAARNAG